MGECKETTNKELLEKLEKMDKKLNAIGNALLIFISVNGKKGAKEIQRRQEKEGNYSGIDDDLGDQIALINVCDDLKKAMEEKKNTVDEDILDDLVDRLIKTFFS